MNPHGPLFRLWYVPVRRNVMTLVHQLANQRLVPAATGFIALVASALLGAMVVSQPTLALLPLAGVLVVLFVRSPFVRFSTLIIGSMAVFQRTQGIDPFKLAILAAFAAAAGIALIELPLTDRTSRELVRELRTPTLAFGAVVIMSLGVAISHGTPLENWSRDAIPYLILLVAPLLALNATRTEQKFLVWLLVVAGVLAAASVGITWASRRGLAEFGLSRLLLSAPWVAFALVAYAVARYLYDSEDRFRWIAVVLAVSGFLLISGNRSAFFPYIGLIALIFGPAQQRLRGVFRLAPVFLVTLLAGLAALAAAARVGFVSQEMLSKRYDALILLFTNPASDPSFVERRLSVESIWSTFRDYPITGAGLGYPLPLYHPTSLTTTYRFTIDSSLAILSEMGVVGAVCLVWLLKSYFSLALASRRSSPWAAAPAALLAFLVAAVLSAPLVQFYEDKSFALGLLLLLALTLKETKLPNAQRPLSQKRATFDD